MAQADFSKRGIDCEYTYTHIIILYIPTHTYIHAVYTYSTYIQYIHAVHTHSSPCPSVSGVELNLGNMMTAKEDSVGQLTTGVATLFKMNKVSLRHFPPSYS